MKIVKPVIAIAVIAAVAGGGWYYYSHKTKSSAMPDYITAEVTRTDLMKSISATGTVEPEELVNVGAQVSGKITVFENDSNGNEVDYGSPVKPGMAQRVGQRNGIGTIHDYSPSFPVDCR